MLTIFTPSAVQGIVQDPICPWYTSPLIRSQLHCMYLIIEINHTLLSKYMQWVRYRWICYKKAYYSIFCESGSAWIGMETAARDGGGSEALRGRGRQVRHQPGQAFRFFSLLWTQDFIGCWSRTRIRIRIRIRRIRMFLGLLDPDPLVRGMDLDPAFFKAEYRSGSRI